MNAINATFRALGILAIGALAAFSYSTPAGAQGLVDSYAAKVVCRDRTDDTIQVVSGTYMTSVNIYNPHDFPVTLRKKASRARPMRAQANPSQDIAPETPFTLAPMQAMSMDCEDIRRLYAFPGLPFPAWYEGFMVFLVPTQAGLNVPPRMDVQAVYTAEKRMIEGGAETDVETIDVETVEPTQIREGTAGLPDLVPVPDASDFFCRLDPASGDLVVETRNQGVGGAGPSKTLVDFLGFGTQTQAVPGLPSGTSNLNTYPIPFGCYDPNCEFRIIVDIDGAVPESDETNNAASGSCMG